jgi:hypothetical protein
VKKSTSPSHALTKSALALAIASVLHGAPAHAQAIPAVDDTVINPSTGLPEIVKRVQNDHGALVVATDKFNVIWLYPPSTAGQQFVNPKDPTEILEVKSVVLSPTTGSVIKIVAGPIDEDPDDNVFPPTTGFAPSGFPSSVSPVPGAFHSGPGLLNRSVQEAGSSVPSAPFSMSPGTPMWNTLLTRAV